MASRSLMVKKTESRCIPKVLFTLMVAIFEESLLTKQGARDRMGGDQPK